MKANAKTTDTNQLTSFQKKRQVNLRWNHTRNFQLGLILSILFVIILVESVRVEIKEIPITIVEDTDEEVFLINEFFIETPQPKTTPIARSKPTKRVTEVLKVVDNSFDEKSEPTLATKPPVIEVDPGAKVVKADPSKEAPPNPVYLNFVSQIPLFPGCDESNDRDQQIECFTKKTHRFVTRKFDYNIGAKENLSGRVRILCQFTIDVNGDIGEVKVRTTSEALKKEALKVISELPKMSPGRHNGKAVPVVFSLPIVFEVQD